MKGGVQTVRRLTLYLLLFVMVVIAASGLTGLIGRMLEGFGTIAADDNTGLAQSLAFTLIAGPLAAVLWWLVWRSAAMKQDHESISWPVYLVIASTVSLFTFTNMLFQWAASGIGGTWEPALLAGGVVWALVWLWHRWMWRHPTNAPTRLVGVAPAIGWVVAVTLGIGGAVFTLGSLLSSAIDSLSAVSIGSPWWVPVLQAAVWMVGGGALWWWLWNHDGVKLQTTGFFGVMLVIVTGFGALGVCLFGVARSLYVALRVLAGSTDGIVATLEPLGVAVSASLVGALALLHFRSVVLASTTRLRSATRLVSSGLTLAIAASGFGVTVNALLASLATPLADAGSRPLLLGGLSALIVGGVSWWVFWRPGSTQQEPAGGRRIYLVVIFGVSAFVALITLLVIGYQLFVFALVTTAGGGLLDSIRQALGLLTATALVAIYHFALWRRNRPAASEHREVASIGQIVLVTRGGTTDAGSAALEAAVRKATGARVTVWHRDESDAAGSPDDAPSADTAGQQAGPDPLIAALEGVTAARVLVIDGEEPQVIRLGK